MSSIVLIRPPVLAHVGQTEAPTRPRRAVLLQGPVGPFFGQLQDELDLAGWQTVRILFNSGDTRFRGKGRELSFGGSVAEWAAWFAGFVKNFAPDAVLAFGDQRAMHRTAAAIAAAAGTPFVSFEEGYLRPEYVTMELHGNNAASPLRRWRETEAPAPEIENPVAMPGNGFAPTARYAVSYFIALRLGMLRFPYYKHHRERGLIRESLMWTRNFLRKQRYMNANLRKIHWIVEALDQSYFVVALQVHDDLQLRHHGGGWSVERLIEAAIGSFARNAHDDHHLVFKGHPLDRGHGSARDLTRKLARLLGVERRVHFLDDGSLGLLTRHSRGMVTVNSTSAMVAFAHSKPVFAAGESFYEHLAANGEDRSPKALDRFWRLTPQLDMRRWLAFRAHMIATSQVNGSYYIPAERAATARRVVARLDELLARAAREAAMPPIEASRAPKGRGDRASDLA